MADPRTMRMGIAIVLALCAPAHGDDRQPSARLFDEARALEADGKLDEACDRYTKSYELEAAAGTLLHLGDCAERAGDLARAWRIFDRAALDATTESRRRYAEERRDKLASQLVTITLAIAEPDDYTVTIGSHRIAGRHEIRDAVPAGAIVVTATAPGRPEFRREVHGEAGESIELAIRSPAPAVRRPHGWRNALIASGSVAVAALAVELYAASEVSDAASQIHPMNIGRNVTDADCDGGLPPDAIVNVVAFDRACKLARYERYAGYTFDIAAVATVVSLVGFIATWHSEERPAIAVTPTRSGATATFSWSW